MRVSTRTLFHRLLALFLLLLLAVLPTVSPTTDDATRNPTLSRHPQFNILCNRSLGTPRELNVLDYDVLVVGAGLSGAVLAQQHAERLGMRVLVLEKRDHIAGNTCVRWWSNAFEHSSI